MHLYALFPRHVPTLLLILGLLIGGLSVPAFAKTAPGSASPWTFSLYFENDLFAGTDRNYTNGIKLSLISPDLSAYRESGHLPEWTLPWIRRLPFINEPGLQRNIGLCLGQNMYTPVATERRSLVRHDRPYAGWTYAGIAFHSKNRRRLDTIEIQAGMVGPASLAEETQSLVHRLRRIDVPEGWDHQLENEPGLVAIYERKYRMAERAFSGGFALDAIGHLGATLGNVSTYANAGMELRAGWNLPLDFGSALIRPAGDTNAPVSATGPRIDKRSGFGLHAFGAVSGRAVLRDIFLDGNTFSHSHSVDKEPFVADLSAGLCLVWNRIKISYSQVFRTREFEGQEERHSFGSVTISLSY